MSSTPLPLGRPSVLRHSNALRTLEFLRQVDTCSRADLVRSLGLSAPTVTSVVRDLLAANLVEPLGEGISRGGRPPDMIRFKAERSCLAAVQLTAKAIHVQLTDLRGLELASNSLPISRRASDPPSICRQIRDDLRSMLRGVGRPRTDLLATVVGVPAIADVERGIVTSISTLQGWRAVPLRSMLRKLLTCAVLVENDTNLAALGEGLRGAAVGQSSFVLVSLDTNVSAGIVLNGHLHHGARWAAGEIGYLQLPAISRRLPSLHEFGELESFLTTSGLEHAWANRRASGASSATAPARPRSAVEILELASTQRRARTLVEARASLAADLVVNLSVILNPGLIIFAGTLGSHPVLLQAVQKQLANTEFPLSTIVPGKLGDAATLAGAIAVALQMLPGILITPRASAPNSPE